MKNFFMLAVIVFTVLSIYGCKKKWNNFQKKLLDEQAKSFSMANKNPEKFQKCYENAVMDDYSGEEWMTKSKEKAMVYFSRCTDIDIK